jgi:hypothetical protein
MREKGKQARKNAADWSNNQTKRQKGKYIYFFKKSVVLEKGIVSAAVPSAFGRVLRVHHHARFNQRANFFKCRVKRLVGRSERKPTAEELAYVVVWPPIWLPCASSFTFAAAVP